MEWYGHVEIFVSGSLPQIFFAKWYGVDDEVDGS
jgi:hypothetical protein